MKQLDSIIHIMIIWSNAVSFKDHIVEELDKEFTIHKIFKINWSKELFEKNLSIFYSHSLKDMPIKQVNKIIRNKRKNVGDNGFYAIVFEDLTPKLEERKTTSGVRVVNARVFDKKIAFRKLTGGSSRIHCSDDMWETNKDLTILFGLNIKDFFNQYQSNSKEIETINRNSLGVNGYESISSLFYVLNNTVKYCVLRNHECIPDEYTIDGHGDIDLLVEHKDYAVRLTGARPVFPQSYRVYHIINIAGQNVPFDFRNIGDDYYDLKWEQNILTTRVLNKNLFYIPSPENQYYSLLYHAFVQKPWVKQDYPPKLLYYGEQIGVVFKLSIVSSIKQISDFLNRNGYTFVRPKDKTVYYNTDNIKNLEVWNDLHENTQLENLTQVNENYKSLSNYYYFKGIFKGKEVFIKYGGVGETCTNEYIQTQKVYRISPSHFLEPISLEKNKEDVYLILEWVNGVSIEDYLKESSTQKKEIVKKQLIEIYESLQEANVMHRDIRPDNFLVVGDTVKLIDFQYAIDCKSPKELNCVKNRTKIAVRLGNWQFKYKPYAWKDSASILKCMKYLGLDTSDVKLSKDKAFYMSIFKCYGYKIFIKLLEIKRKL